MSNLASRVLIIWWPEEAWLLLLLGMTCSVEDEGRTGGSKKVTASAEDTAFIPPGPGKL